MFLNTKSTDVDKYAMRDVKQSIHDEFHPLSKNANHNIRSLNILAKEWRMDNKFKDQLKKR